ncbi:MAG: hypothetical protein HQK91_04520 [Nitrospirae bacterium]|nr:hypothetical protein [Nitrospirota bacterium]
MIKTESGSIVKLIGFLIVIIGIFFIVWMRSSIKSLEYRLAKYQAIQTELIKKQRNLYAIRDNELSIQNVNKVVKELGFDIPDRSKVYYVKSQKVSGLGSIDPLSIKDKGVEKQ